jgi:hypothetical protein
MELVSLFVIGFVVGFVGMEIFLRMIARWRDK